jgi:hypothetical protein
MGIQWKKISGKLDGAATLIPADSNPAVLLGFGSAEFLFWLFIFNFQRRVAANPRTPTMRQCENHGA